MEEWRDIVGYEGLYQVSSFGRVRSLDKYILRSNGVTQFMPGKVMKQRVDAYGYMLVGLCLPVKRYYTAKVHRLVASAFLGCSELEVDHIDGNRKNNLLINLRWATSSENKLNRHKCVGASGYVGVRKTARLRKPYQAYTAVSGVFKHLGLFATPEEASAARAAYLEGISA